MEYIKVIILSFSSIVVLFIITKILGNRQVSQLSLYDYIVGITIGSIAAEMSTSLEEDYLMPLIAMIIYAISTFFISKVTLKSIKIRRFIAGKSVVIYNNGVIYKENLKKAHMDIQDFLVQCRTQGYFDLSEIEIALLEFNGKISILPQAPSRPVTPENLNIPVENASMQLVIITDGIIIEKNLKELKKDLMWMQKQLVSYGYKSEKEIFLATCDYYENINFYTYKEDKNADLFKKSK